MVADTKLYDGMNKSTTIHDARNDTPQSSYEKELFPLIVRQELNENALSKDKVKQITNELLNVKKVKLPKIGIRPVTHQGTQPNLHKSSIPGQLKQAINFVYYKTNLPVLLKMDPNGKILVPTEKTNLDNPGGIQNLIERCIIPPHADVGVAFTSKNNVPLLNPVKPKLFDQEFKKERIWEFQPHIYDTTVRLVSSRLPKRALTALESAIINSPSPASLIQSINDPAPLGDYNDKFRPIPGKQAPGWVIIVENGNMDDTTGAYAKFHTKIREMDIKSISSWIIDGIISMSIKYSIPSVILDCETIIKRCKDPLTYPLPFNVMFDCIYNKKTVNRFLNAPGRLFLNADIGKELAASLIQSVYRHYRTRVQRHELLELHRATRVFKHYWSLYKIRKRFYGVYRAKLNTAYEAFKTIQQNFVNSNEELHAKQRIMIVIVPKNLKKPNEFMDIERLFPMAYDPHFDIAHYPNPLETGKLQVIIPENAKHFQDRSLTETTLYFSQFALEKIKELCQKRSPIVIADEFSIFIAGICAYLNCPYFGPSVLAEEKMRENKCIVSKWLNDAESNVLATEKYWVSKAKELKELRSQITDILKGKSESLLWKFTRANNFGGLMDFFPIIYTTKEIQETVFDIACDQSLIINIWGSGGILEIVPISNRNFFNVVEVGFYIPPEGSCRLIASSETIMVDEKPFGTYIPQQSISQLRIQDMLYTISSICKSNGIIGYISFECLSRDKSFTDVYISRIVPRLTYNVFRAVTVAVKARLVHEQSTFSMRTNYTDLHWNLPYLSKSTYIDKTRIVEDYLKLVPKYPYRVAYYSDIADHNMTRDLNPRLCAVKLIHHGVTFNDWTVDGVTFPYEEKSLAVLCIAQTKEQALESYLAVLCAMERVFFDPDIHISHNLLPVSQIVATELWELRKESGSYQDIPPQPDFTFALKKLKYLLEPYMKAFYPEPKSPQLNENDEEQVPVLKSTAAIRLLTEDIPSVVAYQNDHSLKKPVPLTKLNRRNTMSKNSQVLSAQKQLEQKLANDRAAVVLEEVEQLMNSDDPEIEKILATVRWHKLKKLDE